MQHMHESSCIKRTLHGRKPTLCLDNSPSMQLHMHALLSSHIKSVTMYAAKSDCAAPHLQAAVLNHFLDHSGLATADELLHRAPEAIRTLPVYEAVLALVAQVRQRLHDFAVMCTPRFSLMAGSSTA